MTNFLDIDTSDAVEPQILEDRTEAKIRIIGFRTGDGENEDDNIVMLNKNGERYMAPIYNLTEHPFANNVSDYLGFPEESMDAGKQNKAKLKIEKWRKCFDLPEGKLDLNFVAENGAEGWAILGKKENDFTGEHENTIRKYMNTPF